MFISRRFMSQLSYACVLLLACSGGAFAAPPTAVDALKLKPVQEGVEYDQPSADEIKDCTIKAEKIDGHTAWVVRSADGTVLRQFSNSNEGDDNYVDRWSYFHHGLEVYRDVDSDYNGKADQYRWYHTAGSRVGIDRNEDRAIDAWQRISAEEAAEEVVAALKTKDAARFKRVLAAADEISKMGLSKELAGKLAERTKTAEKSFAQVVASGDVPADSEFADFGGIRPGMIPVGTRGSTKELLVYENAWAMVLANDQHQQLRLGTMVRAGDAWKLIDGPAVGNADQETAGFFFDVSGAPETSIAGPVTQPNEEMQELLTQLEQLDQKLETASGSQQQQLSSSRVDLLERLADASTTPQEREIWLQQLADMIGSGEFPQGIRRLQQWEAKLAKDPAQKDLLAHFQFRRMVAQYSQDLSDPKADQMKVLQGYLEKLEKFVDQHGSSEHAAEALLQLAMNNEFSGKIEDSLKSYQRIVKDFPNSYNADKARGAVTRLRSEGRAISLAGNSLQGRKVDLRSYRGKVVLIHYWATFPNAGSDNHTPIRGVYSKYGSRKFDVIGVNLDFNRDDALTYLKSNRLPWQQLHESGGLESRLAKEMGVVTVPLMILVGADGKVVRRELQLTELEDEVKKLLETRVSQRP